MHVRGHCSNVLLVQIFYIKLHLSFLDETLCIPIDVTDDENQNESGRKSFPAGVILAHNTSHSDFKGFAYEQDDYYKVQSHVQE